MSEDKISSLTDKIGMKTWHLKFNKFYLVIFNIFYINYCVNELLEIERKESFLNKEEL